MPSTLEGFVWGVTGYVSLLWIGCLAAYLINKTDQTHKWQQLHFFSGSVHLASSTIVGWLITREEIVWDAPTYSIISIWQSTTNASCADEGRCYVDVLTKEHGSIPIIFLTILFGLVSGSVHLLAAVINPSKLKKYCETGVNDYRWCDYIVSASLMITTVAALSGVLNVILVACVLPVTHSYFMLIAALIEKELASSIQTGNSNVYIQYRNVLFATCFVYVIVIWVPIIVSFYESIAYAPQDVPNWIQIIVWVLFLLFMAFAGNMIYHLIYLANLKANDNDKTRLFIKQELGYVFLSMSSKLALQWMLYSGITSRSGVLFNSYSEAISNDTYHRSGNDNVSTTLMVAGSAIISIIIGIVGYIYFRWQILSGHEAENNYKKISDDAHF